MFLEPGIGRRLRIDGKTETANEDESCVNPVAECESMADEAYECR